MNFKFVKKVEGAVRTYGGGLITTGEVIELDGWLAEKALSNPDYKRVRGKGEQEESKEETTNEEKTEA
jgi:hypothetical protein